MPRKKQESGVAQEFTTRWRPGKRGIKASKFQFTEAQEQILYEYGHDLEVNIGEISNGLPLKKNLSVTAWKKKKALEIFELPAFTSLDMSKNSAGGWITGITAWLTNYYNRYITKGATTSGQSKAHPASDKVLRSLALFSGDLSPKEYYAQENAGLLKERAREISKQRGESDKLPPGAARNIALAELWDELTAAEKNQWKERAHSLAENVERNQEDFPILITDALQSICDRGRLGTVVMALNYGYQDAKGVLECGCLYAGANSETGQRLNVKINGHDEWVGQWRTYADQTIPLPRPSKPSLIDKDVDGVPKLPDIDINRSSPVDISNMIEEYITALWDRASPVTRGIDRVLWSAIEKDPEMFYDTEKFQLPCPLKPANELIADRSKVYALAEYFLDLKECGLQFSFYPREEHASDSGGDVDDNDDDDEAPPTPARKGKQRKKSSPPLSEVDEKSSSDESVPSRTVTRPKKHRPLFDEEDENPFDDHKSEDEQGRPSSASLATTVAQFEATFAKAPPPPPAFGDRETSSAPDVTPTPLGRARKTRGARRTPTPPTRELRSRAPIVVTSITGDSDEDADTPTLQAPEAPPAGARRKKAESKKPANAVNPIAANTDTASQIAPRANNKRRMLPEETGETPQPPDALKGAQRKKVKANTDIPVPAVDTQKKKGKRR